MGTSSGAYELNPTGGKVVQPYFILK